MINITALKLLIIITGLNGFAAEVILLRELLINFFGNEFTIGIILANWLLLESVGAYFIGKTADKSKNKVGMFVLFTIIFCIFFLFGVYTTRVLKPLLGFSVGEGLSLVYIFLSSFLILLPVSVTHGALFTYSCKLYSMFSNKPEIIAASNVYILETIGTLLGSFVLYYLIILYLHTFKAVLLLVVINILFCLFFLAVCDKVYYEGKKWYKKSLVVSCTIFFLTFLFLLIFYADKIHWLSIKTLWRKQNVVDYENSKYNNICVTTYEGQYTFFINGKPAIITPVPDIMFVEEYVHLPMLSHDSPKDVLVISGGVGGVINEILKHPTVKTVDYVELDPLIIRLIKKFRTELTDKELNDNRVRLYYLDGRFFVRTTTKTYDVVFIGLAEPQDLQTNRFFSKEFFALIKSKLNPQGILVVTLTGSLTYLSEELVNLNSCVYYTLKEVFNNVYVIPGDGKNIYLASDKIVNLSKESIINNILKRKLKCTVLLPRHIEYKLHPRWQEWFFSYMTKAKKDINSDFKPKAVFYSLSYWNALFAPYINKFFKLIKSINVVKIIFTVMIVWLCFLIFSWRKLNRIISPFCVFTTGFTSMVFSLVVISSFQAIYGYVFHWISLFTGFFMVGATLATMLSTWAVKKFNNVKKLFVIIEFIIFTLCFVLLTILKLLVFSEPLVSLKPAVSYVGQTRTFEWLKVLFLIFSMISGAFVGSEFPVANSLQIKITGGLSKTVGSIYSSDLLGGWVAGVVTSVIFLPLLGMVETCVVITVLKLISFVSAFVVLMAVPLRGDN